MKFGILSVMYGTSAKTLASQIGTDVKTAQKFIDDFYKKYKKVKQWIENNVKYARKHKYVHMLLNRKRRLPNINSSDRWERLRSERQTTNAIIQGSASVQTKLTMLALDEWCKKYGYEMLFSIHDEVAVVVPENIPMEHIKEFENIMIDTVKLSVPNKTDLEISYRWGDGIKVDEFIKNRENKAS